MSPDEVLNMDERKLLAWLVKHFFKPVPDNILTVEDATEAASLISFYANSYFYLMELESYFKAKVRQLKQLGDKEDYLSMMNKKDAVVNIANAVHLQYKAISRMITIRDVNNEELRMCDSKL